MVTITIVAIGLVRFLNLTVGVQDHILISRFRR